MVGDGERRKQGDFTDFAMVSDGQRWWAMIQVLFQLNGDRRHAGFQQPGPSYSGNSCPIISSETVQSCLARPGSTA